MEDALLAYRAMLCVRALEGYRHEQLVWALLVPHTPKGKKLKQPEIPRILRDRAT
jgi:hypothetical protein